MGCDEDELDASFFNRKRGTVPKGPGRIKKYYDVLICYHRSNSLFVGISCEVSPGKKGVSETLPYCFFYRRIVLLPPKSINMTVVFLIWQGLWGSENFSTLS